MKREKDIELVFVGVFLPVEESMKREKDIELVFVGIFFPIKIYMFITYILENIHKQKRRKWLLNTLIYPFLETHTHEDMHIQT